MGRAADWRRKAFTLAALLAVFLQAFVVQTHVHAPAAPLAFAQQTDITHDADTHVSASSEHQLICAVCQALAASGAATLPNAAVAQIIDHTSTLAVVAIALAPRTISYFWQSRAPPSVL
ncbi:MAG: hypothetical protein R3C30_02525 [Hyphomonadaceae bacterium]